MEGFIKLETAGPEEANELERDVVGNDLYGVIRHLHRPDMACKRYTRYGDLTDEELGYLKRVEGRTFLNLANSSLVGFNNFKISQNLKGNVGLEHCMGLFGKTIHKRKFACCMAAKNK